MDRALRVPVFTPALIWTLVVTTLLIGWFPPEATAMLAPALSAATDSVPVPNRGEALQKIQRVLETKVVRQRLEDFGLTQDEINTRLGKLTDAQLHQAATQLEALIPGGNDLGLVIVLLVIAILVVILVMLLGKQIRVS